MSIPRESLFQHPASVDARRECPNQLFKNSAVVVHMLKPFTTYERGRLRETTGATNKD